MQATHALALIGRRITVVARASPPPVRSAGHSAVHKSVTLRSGAHNPKGLKVVDDDGQFLSKGFGE
jgi:hypothetical protein